MKTIFIIDGNSLINREFYGMPPLSTKDGLYTNAILGFANKLIKYIEQLNPDYKAAAFDLPAPTFRHLEYPGYKASRKGMPDELAAQLPYVKELCGIFGFEVLTKEGFEADDIIGAVAKEGERFDGMTYILTGDRDSFQLVSDNTSVLYTSGRSVEEYTPDRIMRDYGVKPKQLIDVKALMGDASDEIPGVRGIGEKTAFKLIAEHGSLDRLYGKLDGGALKLTPSNKQKLTDGRDSAFMSRKLAEICVTVPIDLDFENKLENKTEPDRAALHDFCRKLELRSIIKKLDLTDLNLKESGPVQLDFFDSGAVRDEFELAGVSAVCEKFKDGELLFVSFPPANPGHMLLSGGNLFYRCVFENYAELSGIFSGRYKICAANIKELYVNLKKSGVDAGAGIFAFDFGLAAYVLDPSRKNSAGFDARELPELHRDMTEKLRELDLEELYYNVELPLAIILGDMEIAGFLIDSEGLGKFGENLSGQIETLQKDIWETTGEFNINSPKQLGEILFDGLGLPFGKKGKLGHYSTSIDVLAKLKPLHPAVELILEYRALTKLKSTYCDGLIKLADENGRIHTSFNQTVTATGRLSSTEPNLQNIPVRTKLGREIRKFFIAGSQKDRGAQTKALIDADYSQIELRILAHISGDKTLIDAFRNNTDIHRLTASQVFGVPEEEVSVEMRSSAKAVNFGIVYGISDFSLSEDIGVSVYEARRYIEGYFAKYPGVKKFMEHVVESAKETGYVKTVLNRIRYIPELRMGNKNMAAFGERIARNTPIQGSAADIIKLAMIACDRRLKREKLKSRLILQVHDELIFEAEREECEITARLVKEEMENAYKMDVPLVADIKSGANWYETKE